jgi:hypothetical protein
MKKNKPTANKRVSRNVEDRIGVLTDIDQQQLSLAYHFTGVNQSSKIGVGKGVNGNPCHLCMYGEDLAPLHKQQSDRTSFEKLLVSITLV